MIDISEKIVRTTGQRFRGEFESFEKFVQWYNNRPHGALKLEQLESPQDSFWDRLSN